jgi:protein-disulfide isomerase
MKSVRWLAPLAAAALMTAAASAQAPQATPQQPAQTPTIQQQNEQIILELRTIRMMLERLMNPPQPPQPPTRARVTSVSGYALGREDAPLTMVEFTDLQCPFCREFALTSFDAIKKNWIDTGKLRYISRDFPLDIHAQAMPAARAARCAGEQGKFWEMRMTLMRNANLLTPEYIARAASDLKLNDAAFGPCARSTKYDAQIQAEMQEGTRLNIPGTPMFVLGRTTPGADVIEGPVLIGALPYTTFDAKLREVLGSATK